MEDGRKSLAARFADLVADTLPEHVLAENVPLPMGSKCHARMLGTLEACGYSHAEGVADAADYGVPQHRRRCVLLASRKRPVRMPAKTHGAGRARHRTVRDAIASCQPVAHGGSHAGVPNHCAGGLGRNMERMRRTPADGGSGRDVGGTTCVATTGTTGTATCTGA